MVTRCVCFDISFAELKEVASTREARDVESLQKCVAFGANCGFCLPYVEKMLRTGATEFAWPPEETKR